MSSSLPPLEVIRLSTNLLTRGVRQFVCENVMLVCMILAAVGGLSGFDPWTLMSLLGWLSLGVASSIGFGLGVPTRVLFVWPYVVRTSAGVDPFAAWLSVLPVVLTHALGSALGELPPFLGASLLVRRLNLDHEMTAMAVSHRWFVDKMQTHAWVWVFMLAAWPNAMFDCAGLAAGASGSMSLLSFLSAVVCGKAVIRAPVAAGLVVASTHSVAWLPAWATGWVNTQSTEWSQWSPLLSSCWTLVVVLVSGVCMCWCAREAAEEELRRIRLLSNSEN